MHPLAKQAAEYYTGGKVSHIRLRYFSNDIPRGDYVFSVFAWKYAGFNTYTRLITICENDTIANELPYILEEAVSTNEKMEGVFDWSALENIHVQKWLTAREIHKRDIKTTLSFKLESLANTNRNRIRSLEQQVTDAVDENIRRMKQSELETAREDYARKVSSIKETADRADIYTTLLMNGVVTVVEG